MFFSSFPTHTHTHTHSTGDAYLYCAKVFFIFLLILNANLLVCTQSFSQDCWNMNVRKYQTFVGCVQSETPAASVPSHGWWHGCKWIPHYMKRPSQNVWQFAACMLCKFYLFAKISRCIILTKCGSFVAEYTSHIMYCLNFICCKNH